MIKKIAMLALAASAAFSSVFAADECSVTLAGDFIFTGDQIQPTVKKVDCGDEEFTDFAKISYGKNINAGTDAGSVTITLTNGNVVEKKFDIKRKGVRLIVDDCEKELGSDAPKCGENESPAFTWTIDENSDLSTLQADTMSNFVSELGKKVKLSVAEGVEEVGVTFEVAVDPSVNLTTLFPNYNIIVKSGKMKIIKTKIVIVARSNGKIYGSKDPEFMYDVHGNIAPADYGKLGVITLSRNEGEDVGDYFIDVSIDGVQYKSLSAKVEDCELPYCKSTDDYNIYVVSGVLVIQPATATLTVDNVSKIYGDATPAYTYKATGLLGSDKLKDVSISCAKCVSTGLENVGEYAITASVNVASNPNYKVTVQSGTLTVTPKAATVTMNDAEKTYGDKDPKFTFETEGLATEGETLASPTIVRAKGENVGTYKVSVEFAEGSNPNYTLTVKPGTLTINQKAVTLVADNITKKYGEKDPELTYTVYGIVSWDGTEDVLKGVVLKRDAGENAGEYAITATVNTTQNPNYIVSTADGVFAITANDDKIVVTITGHTETVEYDGKEHAVSGYEISSNNEAYSLDYVTYTGEAEIAGVDAGKYFMGLSAADFKNTSVNYPNVTFNITDGVLVVNPRALVVSANADTITYGDETPTEFTWSVDRLLEGDELDNIHVSLGKSGLLAAGNYELTFDKKSPTNKNYKVTQYETSSLIVKQKLVTVTVSDTSKFYSEADPEKFTYTVSGLLDGDELPELYLKRQQGENVLVDDSYSISAAFIETFDNPNYIVKIRQGHFTIKPCTQRITVAIYGDNVIAMYDDGNEVSALKSFDVSPMRIPGEPWLPEEFAYKKEFVSYKGDSTMTETELGVYPMGLVASDFVNISPNFENVNFVVTIDGTFKITDQETSLATVKGAKAFGLSSKNRSIQVSGSKVGQRFAVLDMQGRVLRSGAVESPNFEVPVSNAGIYMVRVGASTQRIRVK